MMVEDNKWLLTDEERGQTCLASSYPDSWAEAVARAQLKKAVERGEGRCPHATAYITSYIQRRECPLCWAGLREEAGLAARKEQQ